MPLRRRTTLAGALLALPALRARAADAFEAGVAELERRHGGRLGAAVLDTAGREPVAHRGTTPFPLCSTHKFLTAAFVLARVDAGAERLDRRIAYARADLIAYSPATERHADDGGMTVGALCAAAVTLSDNTAANLLLDTFGGPAALTAHLRTLGDGVTRLDRREPGLNAADPGDPRDTTTPTAMVVTMRAIVFGPALSAASRARLAAWLVASRTGARRLRAGIPAGWRAGDKSGSGAHHATNDIAVVWPPGRAPLLVAAYYLDADAPDAARDAVLASVGRLAAATAAPPG